MNNKKNERHASSINNIHIEYECIYAKTICPYTHHRHGSCRSLADRRTHRSTHCEGDKQKGISGVYIIVDNNTIRK